MWDVLVEVIERFRRLISRIGGGSVGLLVSLGRTSAINLSKLHSNGFRGFFARSLVLMLIGSIFVTTFIALILPLLSVVFDEGIFETYSDIDERARAIAITDSEGRFVGVPDRMAYGDVIDAPNSMEAFGRTHYPDHQTIYVENPPLHYIECLFWLEDRYAGVLYRNPFGVDAWPLLKLPYETVYESIRSRDLNLVAGGSTLPMQVVRTMKKWRPDGQTSFAKINRKLIEWRDAPIIQRELGGASSVRWHRWLSMHLPHIQRTHARNFLGVEGAALTLFGQRANELSPAKQYVLAASVKHNIPIFSDEDRWAEKRIGRARACSRALVGPGSELSEIEVELNELSQQRLRPYLPQDIRDVIGDKTYVASSPERFAASIAGQTRRSIVADLQDAFGSNYRKRVSEVRTTIDIAQNLQFIQKLDAAFLKLESSKAAGINQQEFAFNPLAGKSKIGALVVLANGDGQVIRLYDNQWDTTLYGTKRHRKTTYGVLTGAYSDEYETREVASTGKIIAALAIAESRSDKPNTGYSNFCLSDKDSFRRRCYCENNVCGDWRKRVRADQVFAESLNAPLIWRLKELGVRERIAKFVDVAGLKTPQSHSENPIEDNVVLGRVAARPLRVMIMAAAALDYALGGDANEIPLPSVVSEYKLVDQDTGEASWVPRNSPAFAETSPLALMMDFDITPSKEGRAYIKKVLSAPACLKDGTLKNLTQWCPKNGRIEALIVKTGTKGLPNRAAKEPDNYDWWVTGAVAFSEADRYSFLILVGTGDPSKLFSSDGAGTLSPIVDLILKTAETDNNRKKYSVSSIGELDGK